MLPATGDGAGGGRGSAQGRSVVAGVAKAQLVSPAAGPNDPSGPAETSGGKGAAQQPKPGMAPTSKEGWDWAAHQVESGSLSAEQAMDALLRHQSRGVL